MNDLIDEYIAKSNGNGNGNGNGDKNGHSDGVFGLVKKDDPILAHVAPRARREVCFDLSITEAARMFYCFLVDCSLWAGVNIRRGVVRFSNSYLAKRFGVSEKTIQNWKRQLIETGRIWNTEKRMKNSFPMTVYNIVAIVGQAMLPLNLDTEDGSLPEDEVTSNRTRPRFTERVAKGTRTIDGRPVGGRWVARGGSKLAASPKTTESAQNAVAQEPEEKILPCSAAIDCRPPTKPIAAHSGKILPSRAEINCRGGRQKVASVDGNKLPLSAEIDCRGERKTVADNEESLNGVKSIKREGEAPPPPLPEEEAIKAWLQTLNGCFPSRLEKMREKFHRQLKDASQEGKKLLKLKIAKLDELLDGPQPEWAPKKPAGPNANGSAEQFIKHGPQLVQAMRAAVERGPA